jgi:two-component sensor histidine kinase
LANERAHQINNPLQSVTNILYLAAEGNGAGDAKSLASELSDHVQRLSMLVNKLLALPDSMSAPKIDL